VRLQSGSQLPHDWLQFEPVREPGKESLPGLIRQLHALSNATVTSVMPEENRNIRSFRLRPAFQFNGAVTVFNLKGNIVRGADGFHGFLWFEVH
jgi:hypothetical protein